MSGSTDLASSTVVVTGAASGIGRALAEGFRGDGATVVAVDRDSAGLEALAAQGAIAMTVDMSDPDQVAGMVADTVRDTGRLDVLINNAGVGIARALVDHRPGEFERVLQVNLFGPFYGMRAALPVMREQGRGRIVNVVSRHGELGLPGFGAYGSSKAALWQLTLTAARESAGTDILVNALIPGPTRTAMNPQGTQEPEAVYPTARMLATLPAGGPSGKVFWDEREYLMFQPEKRLPDQQDRA